MTAIIKYYNDRIEVWIEEFNGKMIKHMVQYLEEDLQYIIPRQYYDYYGPVHYEDHRKNTIE